MERGATRNITNHNSFSFNSEHLIGKLPQPHLLSFLQVSLVNLNLGSKLRMKKKDFTQTCSEHLSMRIHNRSNCCLTKFYHFLYYLHSLVAF